MPERGHCYLAIVRCGGELVLGARARWWEGAFVFAPVEVTAERAPCVRLMGRAVWRGGEVHVAAWMPEGEEAWGVRGGRLVEAMAG